MEDKPGQDKKLEEPALAQEIVKEKPVFPKEEQAPTKTFGFSTFSYEEAQQEIKKCAPIFSNITNSDDLS